MRSPTPVLLAALAAACSGSGGDRPCDPASATACEAGLACEVVQGGQPTCLAPLVLRGSVTSLPPAPGAPVDGARVVALDANRAPLSGVALSDAQGSFELEVPAARDASGRPAAAAVILRADAPGFLPFPGGVRTALPVDLGGATYDGGARRWVVSGPLTALGLAPSPVTSAASVHGVVAAPPARAGVLVVGEVAGAGVTGVADRDGSYALFNLPVDAGGTTVTVAAYAPGANYARPAASLRPGEDRRLDLALLPSPAATVTGDLAFVAGGTPPTSVALVVESTYLAGLDRGESPPGLRAAAVSGPYSIAGVPDGRYVSLASFEADGNVRDLSDIGGTAPALVVVQGGVMTSSPLSYKITGAVTLLDIGGVAASTSAVDIAVATPVFRWAAYSSTDEYRIRVYDDLGAEVWAATQPAASGVNQATYAGAPLQPGRSYQLRVVAWKPTKLQISQTEDLMGVFRYVP